MLFLIDLLYSVNNERFYYKALTEGGDEKKVCLTKEQHDDYQKSIESEEFYK